MFDFSCVHVFKCFLSFHVFRLVCVSVFQVSMQVFRLSSSWFVIVCFVI